MSLVLIYDSTLYIRRARVQPTTCVWATPREPLLGRSLKQTPNSPTRRSLNILDGAVDERGLVRLVGRARIDTLDQRSGPQRRHIRVCSARVRHKRPRPVAVIRLTCCDGEDDIPAMHFCDMSSVSCHLGNLNTSR